MDVVPRYRLNHRAGYLLAYQPGFREDMRGNNSIPQRKACRRGPGLIFERDSLCTKSLWSPLCVKSHLECKSKANWKRMFKLPWRAAGPPNHLDGRVDSDR